MSDGRQLVSDLVGYQASENAMFGQHLRACCVSGTGLGTGEPVVSKSAIIPEFMELIEY